MADWKDILNEDETSPLSEEELLAYISTQTPAGDKQYIEEMAANSFEADALQGLQQLQSPTQAAIHTAALKRQLHKHLRSKKTKQKRSSITGLQWTVIAVIVLLLLCVLGFVVIKMLRN